MVRPANGPSDRVAGVGPTEPAMWTRGVAIFFAGRIYGGNASAIEHRLTKIKHPWTNAQIERVNRTIKGATVKRYHYGSHRQLQSHIADFNSAYNFGRQFKSLKSPAPYGSICKTWTKEPRQFKCEPIQQKPGLNN